MADCELLDRCGFFRKYQGTLDLACRGFIHAYCQGPKLDICERKKYRSAHGCAPEDDMMPTGQMVPMALR